MNCNTYMCISDSATCKALFSLTNCLLNSKHQNQNVTLICNIKVTNREGYSLYAFFFSQFFSKELHKSRNNTIFSVLLYLTGHTTTCYLSLTTYKYLLSVWVSVPMLNLGSLLAGWWRYLHHLRRWWRYLHHLWGWMHGYDFLLTTKRTEITALN